MTKEEAALRSGDRDRGFAFSTGVNQFFWHKSGRAWRTDGPKLIECSASELSTVGWKPGFQNPYWRSALTYAIKANDSSLLQLLDQARGYQERIEVLGAEIRAAQLDGGLKRSLTELMQVAQSLQELL